MFEFAEGFGFDLADTLSSDAKFAADFFEGLGGVAVEAEAHHKDFGFAFGEGLEDFFDVVFEELFGSYIIG